MLCRWKRKKFLEISTFWKKVNGLPERPKKMHFRGSKSVEMRYRWNGYIERKRVWASTKCPPPLLCVTEHIGDCSVLCSFLYYISISSLQMCPRGSCVRFIFKFLQLAAFLDVRQGSPVRWINTRKFSLGIVFFFILLVRFLQRKFRHCYC